MMTWRKDLKLFSCIDLNTGVTCAVVGKDGTGSREAISVLVEEDITFILNELALPEDTVHLSPAARPTIKLNSSL